MLRNQNFKSQWRIWSLLGDFWRVCKEEIHKSANIWTHPPSLPRNFSMTGKSVLFTLISIISNDSQGRSDSKSKHTSTERKDRSLWNELVEEELTVEVTRIIKCFFEGSNHYTHYFVLKVYNSSWVLLRRQMRCAPNKPLSEKQEIKECRGRVTWKDKFQSWIDLMLTVNLLMGLQYW